MYKYYKFDIGDAVMRRDGAIVELLDSNGEWKENRELLRKFIGGDCDFSEITEAEAFEFQEKRLHPRRWAVGNIIKKL